MYTLGRRRGHRAGLGSRRRNVGHPRPNSRRTVPSRPGSAWATRDVATHLVRTRLPRGRPSVVDRDPRRYANAGAPASRCCRASDDRLETHVVVGGEGGLARTARHRPSVTTLSRNGLSTSRNGGCGTGPACRARRFVFVGAESAKPGAGVLDAISTADVIMVAPSKPGRVDRNPSSPSAASATRSPPRLRRSSATHRSSADLRLRGHGRQVSGRDGSVGRERGRAWAGSTGARSGGGLLDAWLVDDSDAGHRCAPASSVHVGPFVDDGRRHDRRHGPART